MKEEESLKIPPVFLFQRAGLACWILLIYWKKSA